MPKKLTQDEWVARALAVHGDRYDYSKVVYVRGSDKVTIICPVHGEFQQAADPHMRGFGCRQCANDALPEKMSDTLETFIKKARKTHGDCYDYSKVVYAGANSKVVIVCSEHGEFLQAPKQHIYGNKCPACGYGERELLLPQEEYLDSVRKVHGDKYDYSEVVYRGAREKITISCNACGNRFKQTANAHQAGTGCPKCAKADRLGRVSPVKALPSVEYLLARFNYDRGRGELIYKASSRNVVAGSVAGSTGRQGYRSVEIDGVSYQVARLIAHIEGNEINSVTEVDHINGVRDDNRISNLRVTDHTGNCRNLKLRDENMFGCPGIRKKGNRFQAVIGVETEVVVIGWFPSLEEAIAARKEAEKKFGFHENHGKTDEERSMYKTYEDSEEE